MVLGSSLLAAGVNFLGSDYRDKQNANRENKRKLQEETVNQYGELGKKIGEFEASLRTGVLLYQNSLQSSDQVLDQQVQRSLVEVANKNADVQAALNAGRIADQQIRKRVEGLFEELPQLLAESQSDKKAVVKIVTLWKKKLEQEIKTLKTDIETVRNNVPLEP